MAPAASPVADPLPMLSAAQLGGVILLLSTEPSSERFELRLAGGRMYETGIAPLEYVVEDERA